MIDDALTLVSNECGDSSLEDRIWTQEARKLESHTLSISKDTVNESGTSCCHRAMNSDITQRFPYIQASQALFSLP